ncbi:MAG: hypothetical protein WCC53_04705 [Thermoanaerobaculia bacterium]
MKKALVFGVVLLSVGAYLFGFLPQRQRRLALEAQVASLELRLKTAEARGRLYALYTRSQGLLDLVAQQNYGHAQQLSSGFFDDVRAEAGRTPEPEFGKALLAVLSTRDAVTAGLTKADPGTLEPLRRATGMLQAALEKPETVAPSSDPKT